MYPSYISLLYMDQKTAEASATSSFLTVLLCTERFYMLKDIDI